jgi:hypothetical protein
VTAVLTVVPIKVAPRSGTMASSVGAAFADDPATILADPQWRDPEVE